MEKNPCKGRNILSLISNPQSQESIDFNNILIFQGIKVNKCQLKLYNQQSYIYGEIDLSKKPKAVHGHRANTAEDRVIVYTQEAEKVASVMRPQKRTRFMRGRAKQRRVRE